MFSRFDLRNVPPRSPSFVRAQIHWIEFREEANDISCVAVLPHAPEIWSMATTAAQSDLLATSYTQGLGRPVAVCPPYFFAPENSQSNRVRTFMPLQRPPHHLFFFRICITNSATCPGDSHSATVWRIAEPDASAAASLGSIHTEAPLARVLDLAGHQSRVKRYAYKFVSCVRLRPHCIHSDSSGPNALCLFWHSSFTFLPTKALVLSIRF
jgi:hypothetical protein